jgi:hypothetical protein
MFSLTKNRKQDLILSALFSEETVTMSFASSKFRHTHAITDVAHKNIGSRGKERSVDQLPKDTPCLDVVVVVVFVSVTQPFR